MKYTVSLALDCRVDVEVEANSFDEAFTLARSDVINWGLVNWDSVEVVGACPVNATDEKDKMRDYL